MARIFLLFLTGVLSFAVYTSNVQAKLTEKAIVQIITQDFIKTHNIQVQGYHYISNKEFFPHKENLTPEQKSLSNIVLSISKTQIGGDWSPVIYLNKENKNGLVLEKKLNGMNNLYLLSFDDKQQSWKITNKRSGKGTDLIELGLLKR